MLELHPPEDDYPPLSALNDLLYCERRCALHRREDHFVDVTEMVDVGSGLRGAPDRSQWMMVRMEDGRPRPSCRAWLTNTDGRGRPSSGQQGNTQGASACRPRIFCRQLAISHLSR